MCRKALEEGTAIEVVREVVDQQGKTKGEKVQRTVGLPGTGGSKTVASSATSTSRSSPVEGFNTRANSIAGDADASTSNSPLVPQGKASQKAAPKKRGRKSKKETNASTSASKDVQQSLPNGSGLSNHQDKGKDRERVGTSEDFEMEVDDRRDATADWSWNQYRQVTPSTSNSFRSPTSQWSSNGTPQPIVQLSTATSQPSFVQLQPPPPVPMSQEPSFTSSSHNGYEYGEYGQIPRRTSLSSAGGQVFPLPSLSGSSNVNHYQPNPSGSASWSRHNGISPPSDNVMKPDFTFHHSIPIHAQQGHSRRSSSNSGLSPNFGGVSTNGVFNSELTTARRPSLLSSFGISNGQPSTTTTTSTSTTSTPTLTAKHPYSSDRSTTSSTSVPTQASLAASSSLAQNTNSIHDRLPALRNM